MTTREPERAILQKAEEQGTSVNKTAIKLLEEGTRVTDKKKSKKRLHDGLDTLAGSWTDEEATEFDKALASQRTIDPRPLEMTRLVLDTSGYSAFMRGHPEVEESGVFYIST